MKFEALGQSHVLSSVTSTEGFVYCVAINTRKHMYVNVVCLGQIQINLENPGSLLEYFSSMVYL